MRAEADKMPWDEFCDLIRGLDSDTPLGRMVSVRLETDKEKLKNFTPDMLRINSEYRNRRAKEKSEAEVKDFMSQMQSMFAKMYEV